MCLFTEVRPFHPVERDPPLAHGAVERTPKHSMFRQSRLPGSCPHLSKVSPAKGQGARKSSKGKLSQAWPSPVPKLSPSVRCGPGTQWASLPAFPFKALASERPNTAICGLASPPHWSRAGTPATAGIGLGYSGPLSLEGLGSTDKPNLWRAAQVTQADWRDGAWAGPAAGTGRGRGCPAPTDPK